MFQSLSLVSGVLPASILTLAIASIIGTFAWGRRKTLRWQVLVALPTGIVATLVLAVLANPLGWSALGVGRQVAIWGGAIVLALALGIICFRTARWWQRGVAVLAVLTTILSAGVSVNAQFQYLPTVGALLGVNAQHMATQRELLALRAGDDRSSGTGSTVQVTIPGTRSGFKARPAVVWLPPAWFSDPGRKLPVIEMLAGVPGSPSDWIRSGYADKTAQAFAAAHDGVAPILVMPDANGSLTADTECVNSPLGNAETYLTEDVPAYVEQHFGSATGAGSWAIAGLSAGGTCSTMLALRHPGQYSTFADYSGLQGATVGEVMQPSQTTQQLFGGSTAAYDAHQPVNLLQENKYPSLGGWFEVGSGDDGPLAAQQLLVPLAKSASIATCSAVIPNGSHDFDTWAQAFRDSLPWMAHRLGLTQTAPNPAPATCSH